jgi:hypothetical protein
MLPRTAMPWFSAPDYWLAREILDRLLGAIYLFAFATVVHQFRPLLGENGLLPVPEFLRSTRFRDAPSLFHLRYSDRLAVTFGWLGGILAAAVVLGLPQLAPTPVTMLAWVVLWVLYLSIVNVGQRWYSFGWESLLLEAGFLAIFLGDDRTQPPFLILVLFRWLAFRVEFGAGLIKLRGDPCWRDLTCLDYHHETQPMPNPLSWYFHHLPRPLHRVEVLGNFFAQLVAPFGLFLPQPIAGLAALVMIGTQGYLIVSGNYAWLNWITIVAALAGIPDDFYRLFVGFSVPLVTDPAPWFIAAVVVLTVLVVVLSWWPVANMISPGQVMNQSFNQLHLVNTYGAFGSVTRVRYEVIVEGTAEELPRPGDWREYEFIGKPGDPARRPPQIAPYHLRLDWLMWFAALSPAYAREWFMPFLQKVLEGDPQIRALIRRDPFVAGEPPRYVRALYYRYRYTTWEERRATGHWWYRELVGDYVPTVTLAPRGEAREAELDPDLRPATRRGAD